MFLRPVYDFDLPDIANMFIEWGQSDKQMEYISNTGIICRGKDGRANGSCFLYMTNSPMCIIDLFVVNKELPKAEREQTINLLLESVIFDAKKLGFRAIMCTPMWKRSEKRLADFGFISSKNGNFVKEF